MSAQESFPNNDQHQDSGRHIDEAAQNAVYDQDQEVHEAAAVELPIELEGAYSSIGNKHTYVIDQDGKKRVISLAQFTEKLEDAAQTDEPPKTSGRNILRPGSIGGVKIPPYGKKSDESKPSLKSMIKDWAGAENNKDELKSLEAQDALLDYMIDAQERGVIAEDEISKVIDSIDMRKENEVKKLELLQQLHDKLSAIANPSVDDGGDIPEIRTQTPADPTDDGGDLPEVRKYTKDELDALGLLTVEDKLEGTDLLSEVDPDLKENLDKARKAFTDLSVERRGVSFGHKRKLAQAKESYDRIRNEAGKRVAERMTEMGATPEMLKRFAKLGALLELGEVTNDIKNRQLELAEGKKLSGFYDWYARQGGKGNHLGTVKKVVAVGSLLFLPGVGLGIAGAAVLGPVIGGAVGGAVFRSLGKGLVGAKLNKEAGIKAAINAQAEQQIKTGTRNINWARGGLSSEVVSRSVQAETDKAVSGNRRRVIGAVAVGAVAGSAGAVLGNFISGRAPNTLTDKPAFSTERRLEFPGGRPDVVEVQDPAPRFIPEVDTTPAPAEALVPTLPENYNLGAMPWTNAAEFFESPDPRALIQQTLDEYNVRSGHTFEWRQDGMFWEGGRVINPAELADYNRIMAELNDRALQAVA